MTTKAIEPTIFETLHQDIVKRTSLRKLMLSFSILFLGCVLFLCVFMMHDKSSVLSMSFMVIGTAFFLIGVFRLFWKSTEVFYTPTGSLVSEVSFFFNLKDLPALSQLMTDKQFCEQTALTCEGSGNVRLDALLSQDHRFAALQLFQFVPYTYTPVTSVVYFTDREAQSVSAFLKDCKRRV